MKKQDKITAIKTGGITIGVVLILLGVLNASSLGISWAIYTLVPFGIILLIWLTLLERRTK